ncbi:MAG TPA: TIM barrel protein [Solirubrobacteraceae bacterium]|nr:TIM barrel protein [Solirubrobacteraceae bacterium]
MDLTNERRVMRLAYQTNTWGGVVGHPVGVTSIKDLFYLANGSTADAVRDVAAAGFSGVELFDGNVVEYAERQEALRQLLEEHGQELVGVYSGANFIFEEVLDQELWRIERAAEVAAELGAEYLVVGGGAQTLEPPTDQEYQRLATGLERVVAIARRWDLTPTFHPHMSTIVETSDQLERTLANTSIGICPDTGHVLLAGDDPAELIRRHAKRLEYVHVKDVDLSTGRFVPLGDGALDLAGVMGVLQEVGYDGWVTVELDSWPDPLDGARRNRRALEPWLPAPSSGSATV